MKIKCDNVSELANKMLIEKFSSILPPTSSADIKIDILKAFEDLSKSFGNTIYPLKNESLAFSITKPKTAALCYDRVWGISSEIPDSIRFGCISTGEIDVILSTIIYSWTRLLRRSNIDYSNDSTMLEHIDFVKRITHKEKSSFPSKLIPIQGIDLPNNNIIDLQSPSDNYEGTDNWVYDLQELIATSIVSTLSTLLNIDITKIYDSKYSRDYNYSPTGVEALLGILENLSIVDENSLTWEQVLEFRSDNKARHKYKQLIHWLNKDMINKSQNFIENEILMRLDAYEWALKKHGINSLLGELQSCLDLKVLGISGGFLSLTSILGEPLLGLLTTSGILLSKISVKFAKYKLEHNDLIKRINPEVSYVYELKKIGNSKNRKSQTMF